MFNLSGGNSVQEFRASWQKSQKRVRFDTFPGRRQAMPTIAIGIGLPIPRIWRVRPEKEPRSGMPPELSFILAMIKLYFPEYEPPEKIEYSRGRRARRRARRHVNQHNLSPVLVGGQGQISIAGRLRDVFRPSNPAPGPAWQFGVKGGGKGFGHCSRLIALRPWLPSLPGQRSIISPLRKSREQMIDDDGMVSRGISEL